MFAPGLAAPRVTFVGEGALRRGQLREHTELQRQVERDRLTRASSLGVADPAAVIAHLVEEAGRDEAARLRDLRVRGLLPRSEMQLNHLEDVAGAAPRLEPGGGGGLDAIPWDRLEAELAGGRPETAETVDGTMMAVSAIDGGVTAADGASVRDVDALLRELVGVPPAFGSHEQSAEELVRGLYECASVDLSAGAMEAAHAATVPAYPLLRSECSRPSHLDDAVTAPPL